MFGIVLLFLAFGIPVAVLLSLWAGIKIYQHNRALAGIVLFGAVASGLSFLWEMRFDIDLFRGLMNPDNMELFERLDPSRFFPALYVGLFLAILLARFRWKPESGSALALNLALIFWLLAGLPFLILTPGMFAP